MKEKYPVIWLTEMAKVHCSGYYKWRRTSSCIVRAEAEVQLKTVILQKHKQFGYPLIKITLRERGFFVKHKKVYHLMCELQIQSIIRKKRRFFKGQYSRTYPNVLKRKFQNIQPNEVLVTDITYIRWKDGFRYLSDVQDLYNNEVIAWKLSSQDDLQLVMDTLDLVAEKRNVY
ncbi:DDE-type integrase/transposase/recombinase [Bacillus cereus group sp. MYBK30-1]|uniref:DDE-type integrase/transposase/recombinase n=1 Tax=unclassified Bacillus cereus group TaxID=2750818 RepID=UPI003F79DD4F